MFIQFEDRQTWSDWEKQQLRTYFADYKEGDKVPGKIAILNFKKEHKCERDWQKVKYYIRYMKMSGTF